MKFLGKVGNGPVNKDPDLYRDSGTTCLGGGMLCHTYNVFSGTLNPTHFTSLHSASSYILNFKLITFRMRHSRVEMYIGHGRLCVCLSVPRPIPTLLHGPGCNLENGRGALWLCTVERICNRCTCFIAMTTYKYVSL